MNNTKIKDIALSSENNVILECVTPKKIKKIEVNYLLFAIGRVPCLDFLPVNLRKEVLDRKKGTRIHLAGDVKNGIFRQTAIAEGSGIKAAMKIYNEIKEQSK